MISQSDYLSLLVFERVKSEARVDDANNSPILVTESRQLPATHLQTITDSVFETVIDRELRRADRPNDHRHNERYIQSLLSWLVYIEC